MMVSGLITKCMGLGHSRCPTGNTIRAIMKMIKKKVTESSSGPTEKFIKATGRMENKVVRDN